MSAEANIGATSSRPSDAHAWPALDALRALAVATVIISHLHLPRRLPVPRNGGFGVEVFFVLSGFLITNILLRELSQAGRIRLGLFYARRALRLLPALFVMIVVLVAVLAAVHSGALSETRSGIIPSVFYFANFVLVRGRSLGLLGPMWSLAIEEQFYLVWPFVVSLTYRRAGLTGLRRVTAAASLAFLMWRAALYVGGASAAWLYNSTDCRAGGLMAGSFAAAMLFGRKPVPSNRGPVLIIAGYAVIILASTFEGPERLMWGITMTLIDAATVMVIVGTVYTARTTKTDRLLSWSPLRLVGQVSYGLYLWNFPVFSLVREKTHLPVLVKLSAQVALLIVATSLSWILVERPAMRFRARLGGSKGAITSRGLSPAARLEEEPRVP